MDTEKTYQVVKNTGITSLIVGIIILIFGIGCGILGIITGSRLMKHKSDIMF
ncbi:MAG: hypothetical protein RR364_00095 [Lachnospiraceae bacterium]